MRWLLDTSAWIHYLKRPAGPVAVWLLKRSPQEVVVCSVVRAELLHGALKYNEPQIRTALVYETLALYVSLPFDDRAAEHYARVRHDLERAGASIGPNDLFIAAICLAHESTLVTANTGEFQRVRGLRVENWTS